jgi:hypothetical protein
MDEQLPTPGDVLAAAAISRKTLEAAIDRDWSVKAGDLDWSCRQTLDHIIDSLFLYSAYLASRATGRLSPPRNGDPDASVEALLSSLGTSAAVMAEVARAAPPGTRAFHPAGLGGAGPRGNPAPHRRHYARTRSDLPPSRRFFSPHPRANIPLGAG